jgi:hypothetical protein
LVARVPSVRAERGRGAPAARGVDPSVTRVTTLMDGPDDLAPRLDEFS